MQYIGKINIKLFEKISNKLITDVVVLTDKQREHIKERHPEILEKYEKYFLDVIEKPDYILKDNSRENTALILKTIIVNDEKIGNVNLVLRLAIENDKEHDKNSIITCIPVGKNRLKSYIKNGKIVYKYE